MTFACTVTCEPDIGTCAALLRTGLDANILLGGADTAGTVMRGACTVTSISCFFVVGRETDDLLGGADTAGDDGGATRCVADLSGLCDARMDDLSAGMLIVSNVTGALMTEPVG